MIYAAGIVGIIFLALLGALKLQASRADVAEANGKVCASANKSLEEDANAKIGTLTGMLQGFADADQKRIKRAREAQAKAKAAAAPEAPKVAGLLAAAQDPAKMPEAAECVEARRILREYATDATATKP